jgi:hypothetical protein
MSSWLSLPGLLVSITSLVNKLESDKRKQKEDIQKAISNAFHNTEKYYAYLAEGKPRDTQREFDLARDWESASILVEPIDKNLANRLGLKGSFWRDGGTWSEVQIRDAKIQLSFIRTEGMTIVDRRK